MRRFLGFLLFVATLVVIAMNFKQILLFSQAQSLRNQAQKLEEAGNLEKAIALYEDGLKQYPDNTGIALHLAWLYRQHQQPEKAEALYRSILNAQSDNLDARIGLANLLKNDPPRINQAVDELRLALKQHPQNARVLSQLGGLYKTAAENPEETRESTRRWLYDQSRYYYQLSLKRDPRHFQSHFNVGVAFQQMQKLQPSAQAYCRALVLNPQSYEARYNLGLVLSELNYLDEAYRQLDRSVQILVERDQMTEAQAMAQQVQTVKNSIFNNAEKQGLSAKAEPDFIDKRCLYRPAAAEPSAE